MKPKYHIPEHTFLGGFDDEKNVGYEAQGAGDSVHEFLNSISVTEVDKDGRDVRNYGYDEAPMRIQHRILNLVGIQLEELEHAS